jgi:hypothetical protein
MIKLTTVMDKLNPSLKLEYNNVEIGKLKDIIKYLIPRKENLIIYRMVLLVLFLKLLKYVGVDIFNKK